MTFPSINYRFALTTVYPVNSPRSLSDLGGRSEAERDRGHFFDHLRRIVSLFYENDREKAPIS
ncbi:MAG: hypothetical protein ACJAZJ_000826, partial [Candidatus Endobugula sp.]